MGSASVAEDQSENSMSNMVLQTSDQVTLDLGTQSFKPVQLCDQFTSGDDYNPKARKPYTITKQRERWTEEEHKNFLEALKLYGRAWKRIEEHVGSKTAVQIRSHAQKFFTKVVRDSNGDDATEVKPIEIPPPRPKRKPMHPYPRKLASPNKSGAHLCQQPPRSTSPNSSISEQENRSPTSVMSAVCCSDTFPRGESYSPNGSSSSAADVKPIGFLPSEDMSPDDNGLSSVVQDQDSSNPDEQVPVQMEMFWEDKAFVQEGSPEVASTHSLKLFGKTVLVTNSHKPSSPSDGICKQNLTDASEIRTVQAVPWNVLPVKISPAHIECSWGALPCGPPIYYAQFPSENSDLIAAAAASMPWWSSYGGLSFPFPEPQNQEGQEKQLRKQGSLTGSNTGSGNLSGASDKNWDFDTQSGQNSLEKEENEQKTPFLFKQSEGSAFSDLRVKGGKCVKGFVPYKRCLAERDTHSSITGEERDEQRVRLCL